MNTESSAVQVAVYGTLRRGGSNHRLMQDSAYLGDDVLHQITLYDLGPYPGAVLETSRGIEVEVYRLAAGHLALLDELEEYRADNPAAGLYTRLQLPTRFGPAWVYLYQGSLDGCPRQTAGAWREVAESRERSPE